MKKNLTSLFAALLVFLNILGQTNSGFSETEKVPVDFFEEAVKKYDSGEYGHAARLYENLIDQGYKSGNIFYNLGNCYLKNSQIGQSILNYEKAKIVMPADSDLSTNLGYARSLMKQEDPFGNRNFVFKLLDKLFFKMTHTAMILIAVVIYYFLAFYIIVFKIFRKKALLPNVTIMITILAIFLISIPLKHRLWDMETGAIVLAKITDARFEPMLNALPNFPLFEGMKVNITREYGPWCRIVRPDGRIGWVKQTDIAKINPL